MSFETPFNNIHHVEVDDDTISMFQNENCMMTLLKSALSVMIMLYDNILLDLEEKSINGRKYWQDENTVIYTKSVLEIDETSNRNKTVDRSVLCILKAPSEVVLEKEAFQLMLISAVISCRIKAELFKSPIGSQYGLDSTKIIIFHDSQHFSIVDEAPEEQFAMPNAALAKMIVLKKDILRDLRTENYFGEKVYWANKHFQIKSEYFKNFRVLSFVGDYNGNPDYIRMRDETFEKMVHIATSGPSWSEDMDYSMEKIRELFWKSISINTVKSIEFSKDRREFTLINEVNGNALTLPISALEAAQKYKKRILYDLDDKSFVPTYEKDFMNEYWTNGIYAIRTGAFINLYRDIDCNVVRFTRMKDNYYMFVVQKKAFLKLLEELENSKKSRNY